MKAEATPKKMTGTTPGAARLLRILDGFGLLPMTEVEKKGLHDTQSIRREIEKRRRVQRRTMQVVDAEARARMLLMEVEAQLAMDAAEQAIARGESYQKAINGHVPMAARAVHNLYRESLEMEYTKEQIGLYAMAEAMATPHTPLAEEEPTQTWYAKFWGYAKDMRDEAVMPLWGKVLKGEVCRPGSFSLKTLDALHALDQRSAADFARLAAYVVEDFIPEESITASHVSDLFMELLENIGIILRNMTRKQFVYINVGNAYYEVSSGKPRVGEQIPLTRYSFPSALLTPVGRELLAIVEVSKADSLQGMRVFAQSVRQRYGLSLEIHEKQS